MSSNTLNKGADSHADFIPQIWASRALGFLHQNAILAGLVNRDYQPELASKGDTVNVPIIGAFSVNDKAADSTTTKQTVAGAKVAVQLSYHKEVTFLVEDILQAQAQPDVLDNYVRKAAIALANNVDATIAAQYANVGTGMTLGSGSVDISEDLILEGRETLNAMEIPYESRVLVVRDFHDLLKVSRFTEAQTAGDGSPIRTGLVGRIHGFQCFEDPRIWRVTGSGGATHNLMFHRDGIVFASRALPLPPPGTGVSGMYMNIDGVGIRLLYSYNHDYMATQVSLDLLYGVKVIHHPTDQTKWKAPLIDLQTT